MKMINLKGMNLGEVLGLNADVVKNEDIIIIDNVLAFSSDSTFDNKGTVGRLEVLNIKKWFLKENLCDHIDGDNLKIAVFYNSETNKEELRFVFNGSELIVEKEYYEFKYFTKLKIKNKEYKIGGLTRFLIEASNVLLASKALEIYSEFARTYKYLLELKYIFNRDAEYGRSASFEFTRNNFKIMPRFIRYLEARADVYKEIGKISFGSAHVELNPLQRRIYIDKYFFGEEVFRELINNDDVNMLIERLKEKYLEFKRPVDI